MNIENLESLKSLVGIFGVFFISACSNSTLQDTESIYEFPLIAECENHVVEVLTNNKANYEYDYEWGWKLNKFGSNDIFDLGVVGYVSIFSVGLDTRILKRHANAAMYGCYPDIKSEVTLHQEEIGSYLEHLVLSYAKSPGVEYARIYDEKIVFFHRDVGIYEEELRREMSKATQRSNK